MTGQQKTNQYTYLNGMLILVGLYYVYPLAASLQNILFGVIFFKSVYIKFAIVLCVILFLALHLRRVQWRLDWISGAFLTLIGVSVVSFALMFRYDYPLLYRLFSYNVQMFWIILLFVLYVITRLDEDHFTSIFNAITIGIALFFAINFVLALFQHLYNSSIIPIRSTDGYYHVFSYSMRGRLKAFGFMLSCLDFGILAAAALFISLSQLLRRHRQWPLWLVIVLCSIVGVYISYTRVAYLIALFGVFFIVAIRWRWYFLLKLLPPLYFAAGLVITLWPRALMTFFDLFFDVKRNPLFHFRAMLVRHRNWKKMIAKLMDGGMMDMLFGTGITDNDRFLEISKSKLIDNLYLSVTLYNGIIVLLLFIFLYLLIYYRGIKRIAVEMERGGDPDPALIAGFSLMVALAGVAFFNNFVPYIYVHMLIPLLYLTVRSDER